MVVVVGDSSNYKVWSSLCCGGVQEGQGGTGKKNRKRRKEGEEDGEEQKPGEIILALELGEVSRFYSEENSL